MSQSQRWGKVTTTMPVPHGVISTSTGPAESTESVQESVHISEELVEEVLPVEETEDAEVSEEV
jgi:hypothetical protein